MLVSYLIAQIILNEKKLNTKFFFIFFTSVFYVRIFLCIHF